MSRLNNRLTLWEQNRLIAPEQKQLILDFESQNKTPHLPYAVFMLGVFVTALGIISLIAANWEEIGGGVKLTADFILLAVLAGGIMRAQNRGSAFFQCVGNKFSAVGILSVKSYKQRSRHRFSRIEFDRGNFRIAGKLFRQRNARQYLTE